MQFLRIWRIDVTFQNELGIYNVNITISGITTSYFMYLTNDSILLVLFYKNLICNYLKYCQLLY